MKTARRFNYLLAVISFSNVIARSALCDEAISTYRMKPRYKSEHLEHEIASSGYALLAMT